MTNHLKNYQNEFFANLINNKNPVSIYLCSGIKLQGYVVAVDNYVLLIKEDDRHNRLMVYKHAIASISINNNNEA